MIIITIDKPRKEIFKKWLEIFDNMDIREVKEKKSKEKRLFYKTEEEKRIARNKSRREYYERNKELEKQKVKEYQKRKKMNDQ